MSQELYQTVTLILANGKRASFTGSAQIDFLDPPKVVDIEVSVPKPLPPGCKFEEMPKEEERRIALSR